MRLVLHSTVRRYLTLKQKASKWLLRTVIVSGTGVMCVCGGLDGAKDVPGKEREEKRRREKRRKEKGNEWTDG